jgi:hypothetical protein
MKSMSLSQSELLIPKNTTNPELIDPTILLSTSTDPEETL